MERCTSTVVSHDGDLCHTMLNLLVKCCYPLNSPQQNLTCLKQCLKSHLTISEINLQPPEKRIPDLCFLICGPVFILCEGVTLVLFLYIRTLLWWQVIHLQQYNNYVAEMPQRQHLQAAPKPTWQSAADHVLEDHHHVLWRMPKKTLMQRQQMSSLLSGAIKSSASNSSTSCTIRNTSFNN